MSLTPSEEAYIRRQQRKDLYQMKLRDSRWIEKRDRILARDNYTCQVCFQPEWEVEVHHLAYRDDPWDIPDVLLQTRCRRCHAAAHGKKEKRRRKKDRRIFEIDDDAVYRHHCWMEIWEYWDNPPLNLEDDCDEMSAAAKDAFKEVYASGRWRSLKLVQVEVVNAVFTHGPNGERAIIRHDGLDCHCRWLYSVPKDKRADPLQRRHLASEFEEDIRERLHYHCAHDAIDLIHCVY
jgi:hypothetical protein